MSTTPQMRRSDRKQNNLKKLTFLRCCVAFASATVDRWVMARFGASNLDLRYPEQDITQAKKLQRYQWTAE